MAQKVIEFNEGSDCQSDFDLAMESQTYDRTKPWNPDTCTIIEICKNPNLGIYLFNKLGLDKKSKIYLNEISLNEAEHKGYSKTQVILVLSKCTVRLSNTPSQQYGNGLSNPGGSSKPE